MLFWIVFLNPKSQLILKLIIPFLVAALTFCKKLREKTRELVEVTVVSIIFINVGSKQTIY